MGREMLKMLGAALVSAGLALIILLVILVVAELIWEIF
jgi:hypothetical protein